MYIFIGLDDCIQKYKVDIDREKLLDIRTNILMNCSLLKNKRVTTCVPEAFESNYDFLIYDKNEIPNANGMYSLKYYEVTYPDIVRLIDRLLSGDARAIIEIESYKDERENPKEKLDKLFYEFETMPFDKEKVQKKINEIKEKIEEVEINKNNKKIDEYMEELFDACTLTLVGSMSNKNIDKFFDFVGEEYKSEFVKKLV